MIKILLKTCTVMTLLLLPALASAFTTRELSDVAWIATYRTNENFNPTKDVSPITDSHGVTAERIDDTHIRLNGIQGCLDFIFTLAMPAETPTPTVNICV